MKVQLLYFASLREALGLAREVMVLDPSRVRTAGELRLHLQARGPLWAEQFAIDRPLRVALDQMMVKETAVLHDGAEVAFFPPVTGG